MQPDPKTLVQRLAPPATDLLRQAGELAHACTHYEVTVEHLLEAILSQPDAEFAPLLSAQAVGAEALGIAVTKARKQLKTGNSGAPRLSPGLLELLRDAWLLASLERREESVRSTVLVLQAARHPGRYGSVLTTLPGLDPARLQADLDALPPPAAVPSGPQVAAAQSSNLLDRYATNLSALARDKKLDPIFGRHHEVRQMVDVLARRRKNNPLLVGEPGVGKTALVEGLAINIAAGEVPPELRAAEIFALDLGALQAGARVKGEFEQRLKAIINEVQEAEKPIILFIDEAHALSPAGSGSDPGDAANLLKPALARGALRTIAATTWAEYKKHFEKDAALDRRFQLLRVLEPKEPEAVAMLRGLRSRYEEAHDVTIRDEALVAAVTLSARYLPARQLPDKAIDLIDTTAARVRVERAAVPEELCALRESIGLIHQKRDSLIHDLQTAMQPDAAPVAEATDALASLEPSEAATTALWQKQQKALVTLLEAQERHGHAESRAHLDRAWVEFRDATSEKCFVSATVDADAIARTVAAWTGIPVGRLERDSAQTLLGIKETIEERVVGQEGAALAVSNALQVAGAGIRDPDKPVGVFLFVGPSGVGKTETARTIATHVYGSEQALITVNMSEFHDRHMVSRLIGSPPGFVGYGEGGRLTEAVRKRPYCVLLLDEVEKAHPEVLNIFYQVFDKGTLTDGEGREVCFRNALIVLTSNLGSSVLEEASRGGPSSHEAQMEAVRPELLAHFKPALLARMTVVPFRPLTPHCLRSIVSMKLHSLASRIQEAHGIDTDYSEQLLDQLTRRSEQRRDGARSVDHVLREALLPSIARTLLTVPQVREESPRLRIGVGTGGTFSLELA